jgi:hypothetical protein
MDPFLCLLPAVILILLLRSMAYDIRLGELTGLVYGTLVLWETGYRLLVSGASDSLVTFPWKIIPDKIIVLSLRFGIACSGCKKILPPSSMERLSCLYNRQRPASRSVFRRPISVGLSSAPPTLSNDPHNTG